MLEFNISKLIQGKSFIFMDKEKRIITGLGKKKNNFGHS